EAIVVKWFINKVDLVYSWQQLPNEVGVLKQVEVRHWYRLAK
ncbi:hypothetical protein AAULR_08221, partial [Lacticaseibacillus rhamnosus MTCC 5462]